MRKITSLFLVLVVIGIVGCGNTQYSSKEDALYQVINLPDFKETIQYFSVESTALGIPVAPNIKEAIPEFKGANFIHMIIYKTKEGKFKIVLLNDDRPSKIVGEREFS